MHGSAAVLAGVAVLSVGAGIGIAAIPDSGSGVIHGCYAKTGGVLRLVDPAKGQHCTSTETAVAWNQRGITWRGAWSASTSYAKNDAVSRGGSSYLAVRANKNQVPPKAYYWAVLSSAGARGLQGIQGEQGIQGVQGPAGPTVVTGRVKSVPIGGDTYVGAPSGISTGMDSMGVVEAVSPNHDLTVKNLSVRLTAPVTGSVYVGLAYGEAGWILGCNVPTGELTCNSGSATGALPAGTAFAVWAGSSGSTGGPIDVLFGYETVGS